MQSIASKISQSAKFQNFIMIVILAASVAVGMETSQDLVQRYGLFFKISDYLIQTIFTLEIIIRILAYGKKPLDFFKSGWNFFDFVVTALFYMPFGGAYASVLRLVRILRVFRLITALPNLQILVGALIKSIPSIGYVALLLFVQFYIFAIIGNVQFGANDPENFGNLGKSMMTLFQVITLEGWVDIYKSQINVFAATIYFITFILLGTMIILNLFIGVIIEGFDEIKKEVDESSETETSDIKSDLKKITNQVETLKQDLNKISSKITRS